ncbi:MAG: hypothetical protein RL113_372 [Pseudomonadota bacterium]
MRYVIALLLLLSSLYSDGEENQSTADLQLLMLQKEQKSFYKRFEAFFSEYDDTLLENSAIYALDMMMPDEDILAMKKVSKNRLKQRFGSQYLKIPQIINNDFYNVLLSSFYYHVQDFSRINDKLWEEVVCDPETFHYDQIKDPEPNLTLKQSDAQSRGVTQNGIVLPYNLNFPTAYYPYAAEPDGCSAEKLQDVYDVANELFDDDIWLKEACDAHDRCYYTLGTSSKECNDQFIVKTVDSCNQIDIADTFFFMGTRNSLCGMKAFTISVAANACAEKYFAQAQKKQETYLKWVIKYERAYKAAKAKMVSEVFQK